MNPLDELPEASEDRLRLFARVDVVAAAIVDDDAWFVRKDHLVHVVENLPGTRTAEGPVKDRQRIHLRFQVLPVPKDAAADEEDRAFRRRLGLVLFQESIDLGLKRRRKPPAAAPRACCA